MFPGKKSRETVHEFTTHSKCPQYLVATDQLIKRCIRASDGFLLQHMDLHMMRFLVSAEFCGRLTMTRGSLSAGKYPVSNDLITWPPFISHIPELPHVSPRNQTYQSFLLIQPDHMYVSSSRGCSLSLAIYLFIYLFIYIF